MKRQFQAFNFYIKNASDDEVDIYIDGEIVDASTQQIYKDWFGDDTSVSFKSFREELTKHDVSTYNVYINSPGGLVTDAMAIHDLLVDFQRKGKTVNTRGRGIIASAATYILMASKNSEMSQNSWFMIHNVSGFAWGDVNEVENQARTLRKFNDAARDFYCDATGLSKTVMSNMMNAETWMTAKEAHEKGFVKQVTEEAQFTNSISKDKWLYSNMAILNSYNASVKEVNTNISIQNQLEDMKKFFQDLGNSIMNAIKNVKQPENNDHQALMNSIGEVITNAFNDSAESMENAVKDMVANSTKDAITNAVAEALNDQSVTDAIEAAVKNSVDAAKKEQDEKIADLEQKNEDLEKDITNIMGQRTTDPKNEGGDGVKPIGSFKK